MPGIPGGRRHTDPDRLILAIDPFAMEVEAPRAGAAPHQRSANVVGEIADDFCDGVGRADGFKKPAARLGQ